jgi:hypothetical protein
MAILTVDSRSGQLGRNFLHAKMPDEGSVAREHVHLHGLQCFENIRFVLERFVSGSNPGVTMSRQYDNILVLPFVRHEDHRVQNIRI